MPTWVSYVIWVMLLCVIGLLLFLYIRKSQITQNAEIHKTTVSDLEAALKARNVTIEERDKTIVGLKEELTQATVELETVAALNHAELLEFAKNAYQQQLAQQRATVAAYKSANEDYATRIRYCEAHHPQPGNGSEAQDVVRK
jgi:hypothetical protein